MSAIKNIKLIGLTDNDQMVFTSLLSLLSFKTDYKWKLTTGDNDDVLIVDVDTAEGQTVASQNEKVGKHVIRFTAVQPENNQSPYLHKPLRAAEILRCLNQVSELESTAPVVNSHNKTKAVRLTRWPPKSVLISCPGSSRLCAVLMNHSITVEKAASMAGISLNDACRFVDACTAANCITEKSVALDSSAQAQDAARKNTTLFNKLRIKFGARA